MGVVAGITADTFPKQGRNAGKRVKVCFHYDTSKFILGRIVRDDAENPGVVIIALYDGRYVLSTECQYSIYEVT